MSERKPHIHAEVIKAWADGAEIQFRFRKCRGVSESVTPRWIDYSSEGEPSWLEYCEYRVKPHKWQKEMDAYAKGDWIQWSFPGSKVWRDAQKNQTYTLSAQDWEVSSLIFRIKPEPVVKFVRAKLDVQSGALSLVYKEQDGNLKLTFEDGKLVNAEVLE